MEAYIKHLQGSIDFYSEILEKFQSCLPMSTAKKIQARKAERIQKLKQTITRELEFLNKGGDDNEFQY